MVSVLFMTYMIQFDGMMMYLCGKINSSFLLPSIVSNAQETVKFQDASVKLYPAKTTADLQL